MLAVREPVSVRICVAVAVTAAVGVPVACDPVAVLLAVPLGVRVKEAVTVGLGVKEAVPVLVVVAVCVCVPEKDAVLVADDVRAGEVEPDGVPVAVWAGVEACVGV